MIIRNAIPSQSPDSELYSIELKVPAIGNSQFVMFCSVNPQEEHKKQNNQIIRLII
ncbi:hypothetical protein QWZ13_09670 [Reinekea marina]|uniref:hypothetical protein n=1 Tax=Reinekea marina TaxID=1310421 RepID=UPI0025B2BEE0|nr:hypothetical protein [Reinekea marina]MDN3649178.1 hypothetical protein [Reinekea marina]